MNSNANSARSASPFLYVYTHTNIYSDIHIIHMCLFLNLQITERLRDPRGLRKGGLVAAGPRNFAANGAGVRPRGFTRPVIYPLAGLFQFILCFHGTNRSENFLGIFAFVLIQLGHF